MKMKKSKLIETICLSAMLVLGIIGGIIFIVNQNKSDAGARALIDEFFTAYSQKDADFATRLKMEGNGEVVDFKGFQGLLAEKTTYKIKEIIENKSKITVDVEITNVDFKEAFLKALGTLPEDAASDQILKALEAELSSPDCKKRTFTCRLTVDARDGNRILMTDELSNALNGGYNEYIAELTENEGGNGDV